MTLTRLLLASLFVGWLPLGCKSLDKFETKENEAYCGTLQASNYASLGFDYWTAQDEPLKFALTIDTSRLNEVPGILRSNDASSGPCSPLPLFDAAPLRVIAATLGDKVSNLKLGEDHEEDILTFVDSSCSGSMLAILSLLQSGDVELRLLRPAPDVTEPETDRPRFGIFALEKHSLNDSDCGL